jgi:CHAT domain-containing protein/Tfp pilus assembly protein PilF
VGTLARAGRFASRAEKAIEGERLEEAIAHLGQAAEELERIPPDRAMPAVASALEWSSWTVGPGGRAVARRLREAALALLAKSPERAPLELASALVALAGRLADEGDVAATVPLYERAIAIRTDRLGPDHSDVAVVLHNLGVSRRDLGEPALARRLLEQARDIFARADGPDAATTATAVLSLAHVARQQGDVVGAEAHLRQALASRERSLAADDPAVAEALGLLGDLLSDLGRWEAAKALLDRALAIRVKAFGPDHLETAESLRILGEHLGRTGSLVEARKALERVLRIRRRLLGPDALPVGEALNNLGAILFEAGDYAAAREPLEGALRILEKHFPPHHPHVALVLNNLGTILREQGDLAAARVMLERARRAREQTMGEDHPDVARGLSNEAAVLRSMGEHDAALPLLQRALALKEAIYGSDHLETIRARANVAVAHGALLQWEAASRHLDVALEALERVLRQGMGGLAERDRFALLDSVRWCLDMAVVASSDLNRPGWAEALRFKGLVTRVEAAERRLALEGGASVRERAVRIEEAQARLSRLATFVPPRGQEEARRRWREEYARAGAERERLAVEQATAVAPYRAALERLDLRAPDVAAALPEGSVLVDVLRVRDQYAAWVVRRDTGLTRLRLGDVREVEFLATEFVRAILRRDEETQSKIGRMIREAFLDRIEEHLGEGVREIVVSPDGVLATFPFAALPGRREGTSLADDYRIVHVGMAQDVVPDPGRAAPGRGALLVGNVDYDSARADDVRGGSVHAFPPLPATGREVDAIRTALGDGASVRTRREATEANLRAEAPGRRLLHLATHGFVRSDVPSVLRPPPTELALDLDFSEERQLTRLDPRLLSALAFAGANTRQGGGDDDGILTALEVSTLDLRGCELVVLSACESALGKAHSGEGVLGLVQSFQLAGARDVVASLWAIEDEPTRLLMDRFYEVLLRPGRPPTTAGALREAALWLRDAKPGGKDYSSPRHWAAFVAYERR